ncbi:MAG: TetR/AcrR family transcriptional regulator [Nocardioides sp.]
MTESATASLREQKRWETSQRITHCAKVLTSEHGLDGFTMEDLADAAEVSRRTLFNYFPSKLDAVLGEHPEITPSVLATFHAGGPHGNLVDDLAELARAALARKQNDRDAVELTRRVMAANPRLLVAEHERFEGIAEEFSALLVEREGADFTPARARLILRLFLALFDSSLGDLLDDAETRPLDEIFVDQLQYARDFFA